MTYKGTRDLAMPNHATERTATLVNQLAIQQGDSHAGTDPYYTEPIVSPVETMGLLQNTLERQEKVSTRGQSPIMRLSGIEGLTASCSVIICNPSLCKILKNQDLGGKS